MLVHPLLGRLVIIRSDDQDGVGPGLFGVLGQLDRLLGGIRARACHHRNPALGLIDAPFDHLLVLVMRERRALAGGADRDQSVGALGDLPFDQVAERVLVDRVVPERRHQRGERSPEIRLGGHADSPVRSAALAETPLR